MKLIKHLLLWRKRYYRLSVHHEDVKRELFKERVKIAKMKERYHHAIVHNTVLAQENDNIHRILKDLSEESES